MPEKRPAQQLRAVVDYDTARSAVSMGNDYKALVDESSAERIIGRAKSDPWDARSMLKRALRDARREGRQEGLAFGYGQDGIVQEMVNSHLWVSGIEITSTLADQEALDASTRGEDARPVSVDDPIRPNPIIEEAGE